MCLHLRVARLHPRVATRIIEPLMLARLLWRLAEWPIALAWHAYASLVRLTSRVTIDGTPPDGGAIFVNWHRYQSFLIPHHGTFHRSMLVSPAPPLAPVARFCTLSGLRLVRGASGDRGKQALEELTQVVANGGAVTIAVDGPAGPPFRVKRGCAEIAIRTGAPIVPVNFRSDRGLDLQWRWDKTFMPAPFDRIVVRYGPAIEADGRDTDALIDAVQQTLTSHETT